MAFYDERKECLIERERKKNVVDVLVYNRELELKKRSRILDGSFLLDSFFFLFLCVFLYFSFLSG